MTTEPIMDVLDAVEGVRERPILFSAPMVRAILSGTKTQTRRVVKFHASAITCCCGGDAARWKSEAGAWHCGICGGGGRLTGRDVEYLRCPYGQPGDRLWVRETCRGEELPDGLDGVRYLADNAFRAIENTEAAVDPWMKLHHYRGQRAATVPGIHMPRWASRITLNVTGVRVERLQAISEDDARAEGITDGGCLNCGNPELSCGCLNPRPDARDSFVHLWKSINGAESWDANPWVWVVSFQRIAS